MQEPWGCVVGKWLDVRPDSHSEEASEHLFGGVVIMGIEGTRGNLIAALLRKRCKLAGTCSWEYYPGPMQ